MVVEEAQERVMMVEEQATVSEEEVDSLKSQLADYQQALDIQQTRALQYQQAETGCWKKARTLLGEPSLEADGIQSLLADLKQQEGEKTDTLLALKHKLDLSSAAAEQFEKGLSLITSIVGSVERGDAATHARQAISTCP